MKRPIVIILLLMVLLFSAGYFAFIRYMAPAAVSRYIPAKWEQLPAGKRIELHQYLGRPQRQEAHSDTWLSPVSAGKTLLLTIHYSDSMSIDFVIEYRSKLLGVDQRVTVREGEL